MPGFDVDSARQAGYSDDDIIAHLAGTRNFDVQGALGAGYGKQDIINHLAASPAPQPRGLMGTQPVPVSVGPQAIDTQPDARASLPPDLVEKVNRLRAASHAG